jgi:hypothetical protein
MATEFLSRLRSKLGNILSKAAAGELEEKYSGRLADEHVMSRDASGHPVPIQPGPEFKPNKTYLQVVINHMFVKQDRILWVEREHLGAVWMGVRYAGAFRSVPFVIGRQLLIDNVRAFLQARASSFRTCVLDGRIRIQATGCRCTWACGAPPLSIGHARSFPPLTR